MMNSSDEPYIYFSFERDYRASNGKVRDQAVRLVDAAKKLAAKNSHSNDHLVGQALHFFRSHSHPSDEYYFYGAIYHELRWPRNRKARQGGGGNRVLREAYWEMVAEVKRDGKL
ncbi:hypothetical protein VM1G_05796 [Cytospora mali]|uniref:Uncharacterized protein n=1 Tax=Cytospora mali TaxID=578113 RepID=A0A194W2B6_CYTMA|nr:hypothetical protein VM1G_05796 [Valsa mali]